GEGSPAVLILPPLRSGCPLPFPLNALLGGGEPQDDLAALRGRFRRGGEQPAVGGKGHRGYRPPVPLQGGETRPGLPLPELHPAARRRGGGFAIRRECGACAVRVQQDGPRLPGVRVQNPPIVADSIHQGPAVGREQDAADTTAVAINLIAANKLSG